MATAEQIEESLRLLKEHADKFFADTSTQAEFFDGLRICMGDFSKLFGDLADRGVLRAEDVGRYQWGTAMIATFIRVLEIGPKYGSPLLEQQLKVNFRMGLKGKPVKEVSLVTDATVLPLRAHD